MAAMTKHEIVEAFLDRGYFPSQLPPGFATQTFAAAYPAVSKLWSGKHETRLDRFSVLRSLYSRRMTGIPNPIAYFRLVNDVAKYWDEIQTHYGKSKISVSAPDLGGTERAIEATKFRELDEIRVLRSSGYKYVLLSDVSRYFPTIYTHVIPWALHGKEKAKKNIGNHSRAFFGNILDSRSQAVQARQTIGLPIGPDSSHVLAETIGVAIDCELHKSLGYWPSGYRFVDDYCLFFSRRDDAQKALAALSRAFTKFELQINSDKTKILECKDLIKESWPHLLKNFEIDDVVAKQKGDLHRFFAMLYELEQKYSDERLVKYGVKVLAKQIVKRPNWSMYEAYLLKFAHAFPNTIEVVVRIFETYLFHSYPINDQAVQRFCETFIRQHALSDGHSEIAWALWLAIRLKLNLSSEAVLAVVATGNSACLIMLLHLEDLGLTASKVKKKVLNQYSNADALTAENWLLAYEAGRRKWLRNANVSFISSHPIFAPLLTHKVEFYIEDPLPRPLFYLREDVDDDFSVDWDTDDDIDEFFEFEEETLNYSDSPPVHVGGNEDKTDFPSDDEYEF